MPPSLAAYIGKPPPHFRKRKEREISPAVPDPEPVTPSREDLFKTPSRSARVYRTYAYKRLRTSTSSAREGRDGLDEDDDAASRASSAEPKPAEQPAKKSAHTYGRPHKERGEEDSPARSGPSRGRPVTKKPIAIPTPSTSSEEANSTSHRPREPPAADLTLAEALSRSFATSVASATPASFAEMSHDAVHAGTSSVPPKRKPGRPRGRGRGRGLAALGPIVPHNAVADGSPATRTRAAASSPIQERQEASSSIPTKRPRGRPRKYPLPLEPPEPTPSSPDEVPDSEEEAEPVTPVKRSRGRPRKESMPSSTPNPYHTRSKSRGRPARAPRSVSRGARYTSESPNTRRVTEHNLGQSVDVNPVSAALERQAQDEAAVLGLVMPVKRPRGRPPGIKHKTVLALEALAAVPTPEKRRGRPPGSKNKATLAREALALATPAKRGRPLGSKNKATLAREALEGKQRLVPVPVAAAPAPVKRGPGRPRKSAPNPIIPPMVDSLDYTEPLKDPDADTDEEEDAEPKRRTSSLSRGRRKSVPAMPPQSHYLDMSTMQWRPRARSTSESPGKKRPGPADGLQPDEYQSCGRLCAALQRILLQAPMPKLRASPAGDGDEKTGDGDEKSMNGEAAADAGLRVSRSGVLLLGDKSPSPAPGEVVFKGSWTVLADRNAACDDALALKTLHDVVKGLGAYINLDNDNVVFVPSDDGLTRAVAVPCGCMSIPGRVQASSSSSTTPPPECAGAMAVAVAEAQLSEGSFVGKAKALQMTVTITH